MIPLLIDLGLATLLAAVLYYGVLLNRRLARLREDRDALAAVIRDFETATRQAVSGLDGIRTAADASGRGLQSAVDRARQLTEELQFLVERGERAAERLAAGGKPAAAPTVRTLRAEPGDRLGLLKAIETMR